MTRTESDVLIVGSGINSLVCAALLARKGKSVIVLERNDRPGGCIRTEEITLPGYIHDVLSGFYPLFTTGPAFGELGETLHESGLAFSNSQRPTGVLLPDGRATVLTRSRDENIRLMDTLAAGDGARYADSLKELEENAPLIFGLLGNEPWRWSTARLLAAAAWRRGPLNLAGFFGDAMGNCRKWLTDTFESDLNRALFAPWILHTGLGPDSALSGLMAKVIAFTLEAAGMPVIKGGSQTLVETFAGLLERHNSEIICNADVAEILIEGNRAAGVRTADNQTFKAREAVICNVTPPQLYGRLTANGPVPAKVRDSASRYRFGRADMQIHLALDGPVSWPDARLNDAAMVHLTPGLDGVARAVNEADRGLLPAEATIVVAQPAVLDPSRAPEGKGILWIQLQELPSRILGDAGGQIRIPADGQWNDDVREQYADRVIARLAAQIPGLAPLIRKRMVLSPRDLEALNINLVGGDPYSGDCGIDQFLLWRPLKTTRNHETPIKGLYHIGASTHPGPGLAGSSGYMVAKALGS